LQKAFIEVTEKQRLLQEL